MIVFFHLIIFLCLLELCLHKYKRTQFNVVITLITAAIFATTTLSLMASAIVGGIIGYLVYGGIALSIMQSKRSADYGNSSPTYSGMKQTQTNPDLPVPLLYGTVKVAGNRVWQDDKTSNGIKRIVGFSDGEIEEFTDIRLNDIESSKVDGIKIEKFYGTSNQELPSKWYNSKTKKYDYSELGSLKHLAYLYVKCNATSKISAGYNLTTVIKGRKIRVYTTPTQYTVKYSENPAWVMFDFLTSYNGRGLCLDENGEVDDNKIQSMFDMNSFIESANYCDQLIPYTKTNDDGTTTTTTEYTPRFTFNMIFDSQTSHKTLIDEIQRNCRGGLFTKDGKLQFKIDKAENVSKVFTEADILDGSETFQTLPNEENYEVLKINYISPEHEWQKVEAYAELETTREGMPIEHSINCYSCTNFQQASRLAWYYLNSKRLCPYFGSFRTGFKAYDLEVGQVIEIPVMLMGLTNYKVKVTSVINNGTGTYTVNYRTYDERLYTDELGCKEPRVLVTNLGDAYSAPDDVKNFNVVQNQIFYQFTWDYNDNLTDTYEIRLGDDWDSAEVLAKDIKVNNYTSNIVSTGLKKFWIAGYNGYNYSYNPTLDVISIDSIPDSTMMNVIDCLDDTSLEASYINTYKYNGSIMIAPATNWSSAGNWGDDEQFYSVDGVTWGATLKTENVQYISPILDLCELDEYGYVVTVTINFERDYRVVNEQNYISFYYCYADEIVGEWTEWEPLSTNTITGRYIQIKAEFHPFESKQIYLDKLLLSISGKEKIENQEAEVTNADDGVMIHYNYNIKPSIIATVNDSIIAYPVVVFKTHTNALLKIYKNDGTLTTGKISICTKGY